MEIIKDYKKNTHRYLSRKGITSKTWKRKNRVILDFLFFAKKTKKIRKMNELNEKIKREYLLKVKDEKKLADKTLKDYKYILSNFFERANILK